VLIRRLGSWVRKLWFGRVRRVTVDGVTLRVVDRATSAGTALVIREFQRDEYGLAGMTFAPGDVVLDIGANVGLCSLLLAKKFPHVRVYAFEPVPANHRSLVDNIRLNGLTNVTTSSEAVTGDGRPIELMVDLLINSGGATAQVADTGLPGHRVFTVPSVTLDEVFERHGITSCALLKIDCEGSEHEILRASRHLGRVRQLRGEFHENDHLRAQGHTAAGLAEYCEGVIGAGNVRWVFAEMVAGTEAAGGHSRFDLDV
jgi:FkbM family methyltransferase